MRNAFLVFAGIAALTMACASAPEGSDARARELIDTLHMHVLPGESGYLAVIGDSAQKVEVDGPSLKVQSQVYYMLTRDRPVNYLHWLASDDTHILIEGGPLDYFVFHPDGRAEKLVLGRNLAVGERPVVAVPGGCWKALRLHDGAGEEWRRRYTGSAPWRRMRVCAR